MSIGSGSLTLRVRYPRWRREQEQGALLWEPPEELRRARDHDALHALARVRARAELRRLRRRCGSGRPRSSRRSGARSGSSSTSRSDYDEVLRRRLDAGREVVHGRRDLLPGAHLPRQAGDRVAIRHASELRDPGEWTWDELREQTARIARRPEGDGRRARRPRRRLHAEHPRDDRRLPRHREPRRGLVELLARLRRAQRRRPLRPDRAEGAADRRRLPLRRQGPRPQRADRARPGRDALARAHGDARLPRRRRGRLGRGVPGHRRGARVRARALRPPDVGPLLVGHDRPAEGDRALAGRHPHRAPQEAPPARRRAGGRPRLLVHHHRLDDVELPRRHAAHRRLDRALRRQPGHARHGRAVGPRRGRPA